MSSTFALLNSSTSSFLRMTFKISSLKRLNHQKQTKMLTLKLLTKNNCQLCDEAKDLIDTELDKNLLSKIIIQEVDITDSGNEKLYDRWKWEIPVFYLEDKYLCKNRIDIGLLEVKIKDWSHKSWKKRCLIYFRVVYQ